MKVIEISPAFRIAAVAMFSLLVAAEARGQDAVDQTRGHPARVFPAGSWTRLWDIGTDSDLLLRPDLLAVDGGRAVVFDYGDHSVKSIRIGGKLEWRFGRRGEGPGEFNNPTSIAIDRLGQVVVLDPDSRRLTIIDRTGKLVRTIQVTARYSLVAASRADSNYAVISMRFDTAIALVDQRGTRRSTGLRPALQAGVAPLALEASALLSTETGFLVAFRWSSTLLQVDRAGRVVRTCTAIDSLGFPAVRNTRVRVGGQDATVTRVSPKGSEASYSMAWLGTDVAILGPPRQAGDSRLIDLYAGACGRYRESRRFPFESGTVGATGDSLVALIGEPSPHLGVFRWTPAVKR